jgi:signal transduction histidine kinase
VRSLGCLGLPTRVPDDAAMTTTGPASTGEPEVLWRALWVARVVLFGYAVAVNVAHRQEYQRPAVAWAVLGVLAMWTGAAPWLYARSGFRRSVLTVVEFTLAGGALLLTPWAQGSAALESDIQSLPSFWIAAPVLAAAIQWEWRGGLLGASIEGALDLGIRSEPTGTTISNIFLLVVAGLIVGYASSLVRSSTRERAAAAAAGAATVERERLQRAVHDGVLQTLSYIQRRGAEIGGQAKELAELAGEQEEALRGLVSGVAAAAPSAELHDVAALLHLHAGTAVSVATPGVPVPLPAHAATELVAAVRAALDNTARHAVGASAYVLLEDEGKDVVVSVGDDGPGIPAGRLEEAIAAGRMGVAHSIRTRLTELGGSAELTSAPGAGTEWELRVPRDPGRRA